MSTFLFVLKRFQNRWKGNATQTIKYSLNKSQYLSNEMKFCVKFQTAIKSGTKMKHGNFKASRAAYMCRYMWSDCFVVFLLSATHFRKSGHARLIRGCFSFSQCFRAGVFSSLSQSPPRSLWLAPFPPLFGFNMALSQAKTFACIGICKIWRNDCKSPVWITEWNRKDDHQQSRKLRNVSLVAVVESRKGFYFKSLNLKKLLLLKKFKFMIVAI